MLNIKKKFNLGILTVILLYNPIECIFESISKKASPTVSNTRLTVSTNKTKLLWLLVPGISLIPISFLIMRLQGKKHGLNEEKKAIKKKDPTPLKEYQHIINYDENIHKETLAIIVRQGADFLWDTSGTIEEKTSSIVNALNNKKGLAQIRNN